MSEMADCCAEIRAEVAALRAEIAKIQKVDEASIIYKAKIQAKDLIMPLVFSYVLSQLKPIQQGISQIEASLFGLSGQITNFLGRLTALETAVANALKTALSALGVSNQALKQIGVLFAKIAPLLSIASAIGDILNTIRTLET
ncbi:hypothetical protein, partial [uncultured Nostoc sp.]|uniref:hypothetical protein n=1 Tax=uncultured Nostoc sp. TaxID=340711 RepID=UPI0035C97227